MRWLALVLLVVIVLLQHPLWLGKGGWLRVWDVDRQLTQQREINHQLEMRNAGLDAEVRDLKQGYDAIEERARFELGMVRSDEVFVQIPDQPAGERPAALDVPKTESAPSARAAAAGAHKASAAQLAGKPVAGQPAHKPAGSEKPARTQPPERQPAAGR